MYSFAPASISSKLQGSVAAKPCDHPEAWAASASGMLLPGKAALGSAMLLIASLFHATLMLAGSLVATASGRWSEAALTEHSDLSTWK